MSDDAVGPVEPTADGSADTVLAGLDLTAPDHDVPGEAHQESVDAGGADLDEQPQPDGSAVAEPDAAEPTPVSEGTQVVQDAPAPTLAQMRRDFGAHLEANYRRLVAQLYAITLDPAEAHSAVQDAYSRAWRSWAAVSRSPDSVGWVRRVAVRSTIRSWRRLRLRSRRRIGPGQDTQSGAVLAALRGLPAAERRCVVLHHMAGAPVQEIAVVEGVSVGTTAARLARAQQVVSDGLARLPDFAVDWPVDLVGGAFGAEGSLNGFDGWAPPSDWDDHRPADKKEDKR